MENHACVTGWQELFLSDKCLQLSAAIAITTFEKYMIVWLKILRLPNFKPPPACANKIFQK